MRRKLVAGNWKMHGSMAENQTLLTQLVNGLKGVEGFEIAVFPSAIYLSQAQSLLAGSPIKWGAQTLSEYKVGAYSGEISAVMLADLACTYALVGHSERREIFRESDQQVAQKFKAAQAQFITPVLCVGETLDQRESGLTGSVIASQIQVVLDLVGIAAFKCAVIAYEPVWAIGTGRTATPEMAQEVHSAIRKQLALHDQKIAQNIQILYGGSVKPENASAIFAQVDVDGALVGGASLNANDFIKICNAA